MSENEDLATVTAGELKRRHQFRMLLTLFSFGCLGLAYYKSDVVVPAISATMGDRSAAADGLPAFLLSLVIGVYTLRLAAKGLPFFLRFKNEKEANALQQIATEDRNGDELHLRG